MFSNNTKPSSIINSFNFFIYEIFYLTSICLIIISNFAAKKMMEVGLVLDLFLFARLSIIAFIVALIVALNKNYNKIFFQFSICKWIINNNEILGVSSKLFIFLTSLFFIFASTVPVFLSIGFINFIPYLVFFILLLIYGHNIFYLKKMFLFFQTKFVFISLLIFSFTAIILPIIFPGHLSSESYPTIQHSKKISNLLYGKEINKDDYLRFNILPKDFPLLKYNISSVQLLNADLKVEYSELIINDGVLSVPLSKISLTCMLGDWDKNNDREQALVNFKSCIQETLKHLMSSNADLLLEELGKIPFFSKEAISELFSKDLNIKKYFLDQNSIALKHKKEVSSFLSVVMSKGWYFHHYNTISSPINSGKSFTEVSNNQYGLGPLVTAKIFGDFFSLTSLDSIFIATIFINFIVFILLLFYIRNLKVIYKNLILLGFTCSIFVTFALSNMLAPFLFFIRFFPTVLIILLLGYMVHKKITLKEYRWVQISFLFLLLITSFYNYEYAILTSLGIILGAFLTKNIYYMISGFSLFALSLVYKIISSSDSITNIKYLSYFSESAGLPILNIKTIAFMILVFILLNFGYKINNVKKLPNELFILFSIFIFLLVKPLWINSANHVGPMFLIFSILVANCIHLTDDFSKTYLSKLQKMVNPLLFKSMITFSFLVFIIGVTPNIYTFPLNKEHRFDTYSIDPTISSLFQISDNLIKIKASFEKSYKDQDLVLSPNDNFLALATKKRITRPWLDISTNLNNNKDYFTIVNYYKSNKNKGRIIVDKYISKPLYFQKIMKQYKYSIPLYVFDTSKYEMHIFKMNRIFNSIKQNLRKCGEEKTFEIYCRTK